VVSRAVTDRLAEPERRVGPALTGNLPVTKGKARTDRRNATDIPSTAQKARIRASHRRTFEALGYEPCGAGSRSG
jgi:hypothetical protein